MSITETDADVEKDTLDSCPRCGKIGYHNCTKQAGQKSPHGPLLMIDHSAGWPYTDPNIPCDC